MSRRWFIDHAPIGREKRTRSGPEIVRFWLPACFAFPVLLRIFRISPYEIEGVIRRVILIVLDSVGVGALADAPQFGDAGTNTLGHIAQRIPGFKLPQLQAIGLGNIPNTHLGAISQPMGAYGRAVEQSMGKDTISGHWEIAGLVPDLVFPYFPEGFPRSIMDVFESLIGTPTIGNYPSSGTVILDELGEEHLRTGYPIVYTSSDSVFQIAMHEDIIPLQRQYEICQIARDLLVGKNAVGRVIARPFTGSPGNFQRTSNRHDYAIEPPGKTVLEYLTQSDLQVNGVGKIEDIFAGVGISANKKTKDNMDGVDKTLEWMQESFTGLVFTNLVDFDSLYGHRRDVEGYARCLEDFDKRLPEILAALRHDDVLILTADHGNDPTHTGTDHTREHIPILAYGQSIRAGADLGTRTTFADIGATIADMLGVSAKLAGQSFFQEIRKEVPAA